MAHRNSLDLPSYKMGGSFHSYVNVYQRVLSSFISYIISTYFPRFWWLKPYEMTIIINQPGLKPPLSYGFPMVSLWFSHDFPMIYPTIAATAHFATPKSRSPPQRHPGISWPPRSNARAAGALAPAADPFLNPMQFIYNGYMVIWYHGYNIYIYMD